MSGSAENRLLAAVDLGSNSFHMVIAEEDSQGHLQFVDRVKEMVRLNAGLNDEGQLSRESQDRAIDCLHRFGQLLRGIPREHIRAVGTNTFRAAHHAEAFQKRAEQALGHHISVISGHEEARLVYLGAAFSLQSSGRKRLVVDIGGGSTELIIGQGHQPLIMDSLYMGCVSLSRRFFEDGVITKTRMTAARNHVFRELEPVIQKYKNFGWEEVVGASGTIRAVDELSRTLGLKQDWLSKESFTVINQWLKKRHHHDALHLVTERRRPVFMSGYVIISCVFEALGLERLECASGALREGVLYELNGRLHNHDSRDQGIEALVSRFGLDLRQIQRVEATCVYLFNQVREGWKLAGGLDLKLLKWASRIHEIGTTIAFSQHHKHGSYVVEHMDIDGFSRQQQRLLGLLVRSHRQKFPKEQLLALPQDTFQEIFYLSVILRLSCAFNRGRTDTQLPAIQLSAERRRVSIQIERDWCDHHPLTLLDLETEQKYLADVDFELSLELV